MLYSKIGEKNPEYLLADPQGADAIAIPMEPGNGVIARGTLVYRKASGFFAPATAAEAVAENFPVVLDETVDTDANAEIAEDARAWRAGRFITSKVVLKDGKALSAANMAALRTCGIVFNQMIDADEFDNKKSE